MGGIHTVELYSRVCRARHIEGMSILEEAGVFGLHRDTVRKMLKHPTPPGYQRREPPRSPKLDPCESVIDQILQDDLAIPKKQRHLANRIYHRLRDEQSFSGKVAIVKTTFATGV